MIINSTKKKKIVVNALKIKPIIGNLVLNAHLGTMFFNYLQYVLSKRLNTIDCIMLYHLKT
jgi:hypothetical protein